MKRSLKIILIIIFIVIAIYVVYENIILPRLPRVGGIIVAKDNKTIALKDSLDSTERSCILKIEKSPIIKDVDGRKIDISDLNIGDKIFATYGKVQSIYATNPPSFSNIKFIQVEESNKDNHIPEDKLIYNNFIINQFQFEKDYIALGLYMLDEYLNDYLPSNCSIIQNTNNEDIEKIAIDTSHISLKKESEYEIEIDIDIDTYNLVNELEIGKYIFIFENEELGIIKIPFEKSYDGIFSDH